MQLPRWLKTYTMAVTQVLRNSGMKVWCAYAAYMVLMLEMLTKLSLWFLSSPLLNLFLMYFAATPEMPARECLGTLKSSPKIKTVTCHLEMFSNVLRFGCVWNLVRIWGVNKKHQAAFLTSLRPSLALSLWDSQDNKCLSAPKKPCPFSMHFPLNVEMSLTSKSGSIIWNCIVGCQCSKSSLE